MAGSPKSKAKKAPGTRKGSRRKPTEPTPGAYAREAMAEWSKAARFGMTALLASGGSGGRSKSTEKPPLKDRLNPATTDKGGRIGDAADNLLSKLGFLGKAASKFSLGSRAVDKVVPDAVTKLQPSGENGEEEDSQHDHPPVPIQESIDLAVPIHAAFALAGRIADYPQWSDRIKSAEATDDTHASFDVHMHGVTRTVEIEMTDVQPEWRVEWEATEGHEHGGMLTFHELAPSLTHVEVSIDVEPEGAVQRLTRSIHLPERALRSELHRFKAWTELWQEVEDIDPPEPEEPPEDESEEEPADEDEFDEEPEDEADLDDEEDVDEEDEFDEEPEDEVDDEEDFEEDEVEAEGGRYRTR